MSLKYDIKNDNNVKTYIMFNPEKPENTLEDIKLLLENDEKINIYPNSEDVNSDNYYENVRDYIHRVINETEFLSKGLNPGYILDSFDDMDAVVIIGSSMNILPNGNIFGFATIKFDEKQNSIYVDVICSHIGIKGAGELLLNMIEYISRKLLITKMYLKSVSSAIAFYEKYGFIKKDNLCNDMCVMTKTFKKNGCKKRRKTIDKKINRKKISNKQKGGFINFFSNKNKNVSSECDPNNLSMVKGSQSLQEKYQQCCPKSFWGSKNSSAYCKQLDLNYQSATKEENDRNAFVDVEPEDEYQMRQTNITPYAELPTREYNVNKLQTKPWYKLWGGKKTKKPNKSKKNHKYSRKRRI